MCTATKRTGSPEEQKNTNVPMSKKNRPNPQWRAFLKQQDAKACSNTQAPAQQGPGDRENLAPSNPVFKSRISSSLRQKLVTNEVGSSTKVRKRGPGEHEPNPKPRKRRALQEQRNAEAHPTIVGRIKPHTMNASSPQGLEPPPFPLTETDRENLARSDSEFQPHTWENLKQIIVTNDLESLRRWPSAIKRYIQWTNETHTVYGSTTNYVCRERLHWTPLLMNANPEDGPVFEIANPIPFVDARDYKILYNDWPYGLDEGITHLVVWVKNKLAVDPQGDLEWWSRCLVEGFVKKIFVERIERERKLGENEDMGKGTGMGNRVMWFRNWTGLQSVRGLDHIHVLVRGVSRKVMDEWTGGWTPLP
ncbi:MAG: hypothetical protein Q9181_002134 [Wetmoreana brouardii]